MNIPWVRYLLVLLKNRLGVVQCPSFVTFLVTWRCNQRCIMCDIWKKKKSTEMSVMEIERIFSQLKPLDAIKISGGEPFLREDLAEIVSILKQRVRPKIIHLTTNGTLTEKILSFIEKAGDLSNLHIKISIDALREEYNRIRGSNDSYTQAMATLSELVKVREKYGFYLGVAQTVVSPQCLADYEKLQQICRQKNVHLFSALAHPVPELYQANQSDNQMKVAENLGAEMPSDFSREQIATMLKKFDDEASEVNDFLEKVVKKYYLKGLRNRLLTKKKIPNPCCVELRSHLRILPNGDVPVCLYRATVVDNLLNPEVGNFEKFWFNSKKLQEYRQMVSHCRGCWEECEAIPNGVYTGDIIRAMV